MENSKTKNTTVGKSPTVEEISNAFERLTDHKDRALVQAIGLLNKVRYGLLRLDHHLNVKAINGKNKYVRDVGLHNASLAAEQIRRQTDDWLELASKIERNQDIHSGEGKSIKLRLVGTEHGDLADYTANNSRDISKVLKKDNQ